jgi:thiol-disulfide isomerase/thioredoxin
VRRRHGLPLLPSLALLFGLLPAVATGTESATADPLFALTLTDTQDKPAALARYKGKPLVVNFWARWCGPCRTEIPMLIKLRQDYRQRGLEVLGIAIEDKTEAVREFAKAYEMDYPVLLAKDQGLPLMQALGNTRMGLPFTVAVDRHGKLAVVKLGAISSSELTAAAEAALK